MRTTNDYSKLIAVLFLVFAVALRFVPHPANFAPIGALGIFAGCYLRGWGLWLIPVGAMVISDWIGQIFQVPGLGLYSPISLAFVYGGFALAGILGVYLRDRVGPFTVLTAAVANATLFFIVSNFGVWLSDIVGYEKTLSGLANCYYQAIPFFRVSLAADVFYSAVFFGAYQTLHAYLLGHASQSEKA